MAKTVSVKEMNRLANKNDRWLYVNKLGEGSFGSVFLAKDNHQNGKFVAIKVIKAKASLWQIVSGGKPSQVKDGKQEAQMLFRLVHKHVMEIFDTFEFKKIPFTRGLAIVTEYCSKGNLHECLRRYGSPPFLHRVGWYRELTLGLEFIHSNAIIHRDIKPENVLIDSNNVLKIADVGLAKAIWDIQQGEFAEESLIEERRMSTISGTPAYMAPEVLTGSYSAQCDIFSLGLMFCMMVECPNPLLPLVRHADNTSSSLAQVLSVNVEARMMPATQKLNIAKGTSKEKELFNSMLMYHSRERPTASQLLVEIDNLKVSVAEENQPPDRPVPRSTFSTITDYICGRGKLPCAILVVSLVIFGIFYFS